MTLEMNRYDGIPVSLFHIEDRFVAQDPGVIDENVQAAKAVDGRPKQRLSTLHGGDGIVVANRLPASFFDLRNNFIRNSPGATPVDFTTQVIYHDIRALRRQMERNFPSDPPARTRYDRSLSVQNTHIPRPPFFQ
jgi:hypothetical protein